MKTRFFSPQRDSLWMPSLVACYQDVFSEEPWNEWLKCDQCGKNFGKKDQLTTADKCLCGGNLIFFWPTEVVRADILQEVSKQAVCLIITQENQVLGFCWGYPCDAYELEKKLQLSGLAKTLQNSFGNQTFGYIDEVGITPNLRQKGLGKQLWEQVSLELRKKGCQVITARSQPRVRMFSWWLKIGYQIIQAYQMPDERVVIACQIKP